MPPPPAEPFAARIFLGPALRAQPDRRLVKLVREGYETAFEEIVRRYRRPLDRFAAAIVGGRSEDVTQDAFSKALLALRGTTTEIELKPWLYRIVRNTALNEIRDAPPPTEELGEAIPGGRSAAVEAERHEEITELMERLRALPEPQRAAIVMRELEGLSHEEIAAALGVSGGAARQAIYRARLTLRDGFGMLVPLPLLRMLFDHGAEAAGAGAGGAVAAAGAASAAGGGGATLGGIGAVGALKVGVATALVAGSVGAGVALQHDRNGGGDSGPAAASAAPLPVSAGGTPSAYGAPGSPGQAAPLLSSSVGRGHGGPGSGDAKNGQGHRSGDGGSSGSGPFDGSSHSANSSPEGSSGQGGRGSGHEGRSGSEDGGGESHSGDGGSGGSHSSGGDSGGGSGGSVPGSGSGESPHGGSGSGDSGGSGSGDSSGSGSADPSGSGSSDDPAPAISPPPTPEPLPEADGGGSKGSGSGSGIPAGGEDDL
jgi:RNA polymerase sigma factor (sigma-70 family)